MAPKGQRFSLGKVYDITKGHTAQMVAGYRTRHRALIFRFPDTALEQGSHQELALMTYELSRSNVCCSELQSRDTGVLSLRRTCGCWVGLQNAIPLQQLASQRTDLPETMRTYVMHVTKRTISGCI